MNDLNPKINKNLINIVNEYLLPDKEILKSKKYLYLNDLRNRTFYINDDLEINGCCDYDGQNYERGLLNTKIRHIHLAIYPDYWTIRRKL